MFPNLHAESVFVLLLACGVIERGEGPRRTMGAHLPTRRTIYIGGSGARFADFNYTQGKSLYAAMYHIFDASGAHDHTTTALSSALYCLILAFPDFMIGCILGGVTKHKEAALIVNPVFYVGGVEDYMWAAFKKNLTRKMLILVIEILLMENRFENAFCSCADIGN